MESKFELRRAMRQRRRALPARQRQHHARQLARILLKNPYFRRARNIACYLANDGEPDTHALIRAARAAGKRVFLPIVPAHGPGVLRFREYSEQTRLRANRFGILEPSARSNSPIAARRLDIVLAPLVAFDVHGRRLGMGGGYYDRSFAFLHTRRYWQHPKLVGVAYSFQKVDHLPSEPWDVPLWGVLTERGLERFGSGFLASEI